MEIPPVIRCGISTIMALAAVSSGLAPAYARGPFAVSSGLVPACARGPFAVPAIGPRQGSRRPQTVIFHALTDNAVVDEQVAGR